MKRLILSGLMAIFSLSLLIAPVAYAEVDNTPDNDSVAIIRGGAFSEATLREKASQGDVPRVFGAFGINQNELNGFVDGVVWHDGRVTIGRDRLVARDALTAGRWDNPGPGMTKIPNTDRAYKMSPSNFADEGQTAFIKMVNGKFSFAVIKPCGNPVTGTPVSPPAPPDLIMRKDVATMGSDNWQQTVTVKPGDHAKFRIIAKNTGKVRLDKLSFQDILPEGLTQVMGGNQTTINGNAIGNAVGAGFTLDPLQPDQQHIIIYEVATRANEKRRSACDTGLINKGIIRSGNVLPDKSDTAVVKVCAQRQPPVTPPPTPPASITPPPPQQPDQPEKDLPAQLVDTGIGATFGAFISSIVGGAVAYKYVWLRRFV